jgi:hypothetical protein
LEPKSQFGVRFRTFAVGKPFTIKQLRRVPASFTLPQRATESLLND